MVFTHVEDKNPKEAMGLFDRIFLKNFKNYVTGPRSLHLEVIKWNDKDYTNNNNLVIVCKDIKYSM